MQLLAQNLKVFKNKPQWLLFWANELSKKFWRNLGQILPIIARLLWFLFCQAVSMWYKLGKTDLLAGLRQNHKLLDKRISAINFLMEQISDFKPSTQAKLSANYHDHMNIIKQATTKNGWEFWCNQTFWTKLASPSDCHPSKPQEVDKLKRGLSFFGHLFLFHKG